MRGLAILLQGFFVILVLVPICKKMRIRLNFWQTLLLFLPCVIGIVIISLTRYGLPDYKFHFAIVNLLYVINIALVILYQAYLVITFGEACPMKSKVFKWNAYIPAIFILIYLMYVIWGTFINSDYNNRYYNAGPLHKSQLHGSSLMVLIFLLHAFITFYFVNNQFVSRKIKLITDEFERGEIIC